MNTSKLLSIYTRPEIRKGCVWEIQLRLSPDLVKNENIQQIYLEKPRGINENTEHYLCMKVRSKLIKPIRELAFSKVASIVNEGETVECNENGIATLRVRFTARPRAVFHKHSDMMILIVAVRRGDVTVCTDQKELIFRGGTGSVHSADNRQGVVPPVKVTKVKCEPGTNDYAPDSPEPEEEPLSWPSDKLLPEYEDFDSHKFCSDFMQNKGDSLLPFNPTENSVASSETFDDHIGDAAMWDQDFPEEKYTDQIPEPSSHLSDSTIMTSTTTNFSSSLSSSSMSSSSQSLSLSFSSSSTNDNYTIVHGKKRGSCKKCSSECTYYRGDGGPCAECGCYPARHVDMEKPPKKQITGNKRRRVDDTQQQVQSSDDDDDNNNYPSNKRVRYTLETKYFQKLFFNCLPFLSLTELSGICSRAPVPVFVKDTNSVYIYVNPTFCNFILDLTRTDQVLHHSPTQLLGNEEGTEILKQDQQILSLGDSKAKEYNVTIKKQNFRVMKQPTTLRDGQRVIIGTVVSSY